jgi:hypothetical protein
MTDIRFKLSCLTPFKILAVFSVLFTVLFTVACKTPSKPEPDIAGVYNTGNGGDPQGGGFLCVLPNHQFVLGFFGGATTGTWKINDTTVTFKPQVKPTGFRLYGRHNSLLRDSISMLFIGFGVSGVAAIGFDPSANNVRQIFDREPQSADNLYIGKFAGVPANFLLANHTIDKTGKGTSGNAWQIYRFNNTNGYNDFIAKYLPGTDQPKTFSGKINKQGRLDFDQKASEKKPFGKDDKAFVKQMLSLSSDPNQAFFDPNYNEAEPGFEKDTLHYRFNKQKNAYINFRKYVEGEENHPQDKYGSNALNIIYRYQKINSVITSGQVNLDSKPIITLAHHNQ